MIVLTLIPVLPLLPPPSASPLHTGPASPQAGPSGPATAPLRSGTNTQDVQALDSWPAPLPLGQHGDVGASFDLLRRAADYVARAGSEGEAMCDRVAEARAAMAKDLKNKESVLK